MVRSRKHSCSFREGVPLYGEIGSQVAKNDPRYSIPCVVTYFYMRRGGIGSRGTENKRIRRGRREPCEELKQRYLNFSEPT